MLLSTLERLPILRPLVSPLRRWRARRAFAREYASFMGVYDSRADAEAAAPSGRPVGYSQPAVVPEYVALLDTQLARQGLDSYEYPVLHWLGALWQAGDARVVVDFGGNLGTHYYSYSRYLDFPADLAWWIVDVAPIVEEGKRQVASRGAQGLQFTARVSDAPTADLLIASGSFQYLRHVLVNRLPLGGSPSFWTLQNGGAVFYAQRIQSRSEFFAQMAALGYRVVDEWEDCADRCRLPLNPERSVEIYTGCYLRRDG